MLAFRLKYLYSFLKNWIALLIFSIFIFICCAKLMESEIEPIKPPSPSQPSSPVVTIVNNNPPFFPGDTLHLFASLPGGSTGVEEIFFEWELLNKIGAILTPENLPDATFIAFQPGEFVLSIRSRKDTLHSEPSILNISIEEKNDPQAPIAIISLIDSIATLGEEILLDGSGSYDPQNEPLTFKWNSLNGGDLSNPNSDMVLFSTDEPGSYTVTLEVTDTSMHVSPLDFVTVTFEEGSEPVIVIAPFDSLIEVNQIVTIDAGQSFDPDSHAIFFNWQTLNGGVVDPTNQPITTFQSSQSGFFAVFLNVKDEFGLFSNRVLNFTVGSPPVNELPVACLIDSTKTTAISEPALLDGSCSSDSNGLPLTYSWVALDGGTVNPANTVQTEFTANEASTYTVSLIVDNGIHSSAPALALVTVLPNQLPIANAGSDQTLRVGETAILDGSQSMDPEGETLTFLWTPLNGGTITNPTSPAPTFSANIPGIYTISLIVNDGLDDSEPDIVNIIFLANQRPIADAGEDDSTYVGIPVILDGSGSSDPENDPLTFLWESLNGGIVSNPGQQIASFQADIPMTYAISLKVFDGQDWSFSDVVNISVIDTTTSQIGPPPVANAGEDTTYLLVNANMVILDGSQSYDPQGLPLNYYWQGMATNPPPFNNFQSSDESPIISIPNPGQYGFILTVFNGEQYSQPDQVVIDIESPDLFVSKTDPPDSITYFRTISGALTAAQPGYLIFVKTGIYKENVDNFVSNITLLSTNREQTIIDGDGQASTLFLNSINDVTIRGFKIIKGGGNDPQEIDVACVTCLNASNITIQENLITEAFGDGIRLFNATDISIVNNDIIENDYNGIRSSSGSFNVLTCTIADNSLNNPPQMTSGISIETVPGGGSTSSLIINVENCTFQDNLDRHIQIFNDSPLFIRDNVFIGNGEGIYAADASNAQLSVINNDFLGTSGAPIFGIGRDLTIKMNTFDSQNITIAPGMDLINCNGIIEMNNISDYSIGMKLTASGVTVENNIFQIQTSQIGIKVIDGNPPCPIVQNNTYNGSGTPWDYSQTSCPPP